MTPLNFAIVGLRLLGIYVIVESGPYFAEAGLWNAWMGQITLTTNSQQPIAYFSAWIPAVSLVLLGSLLFIFSTPLARRLVPPGSDESKKVTCSFEEIQAIAFATAGILILATTLPSVGRACQNLYYWYTYQQMGGTISPNQLRESWMYAVGVFTQLILGLVLLLNPQGFRNIWRWLRTAGTGPRA